MPHLPATANGNAITQGRDDCKRCASGTFVSDSLIHIPPVFEGCNYILGVGRCGVFSDGLPCKSKEAKIFYFGISLL